MDLQWDDERTRQFVTNVGLITTNGPVGHNIMSAEWTHHVSYGPSLIAISVSPRHASHRNIMKTKEFGVNLAAADQSVMASIAGGSSGDDVDKVAVLKELGYEFYKAKKIGALMVKGAAMNAECMVKETVKTGDHTLFISEVVEISKNGKEPLIYHGGKYWRFGERIAKPQEKELERMRKLVEKHRREKLQKT